MRNKAHNLNIFMYGFVLISMCPPVAFSSLLYVYVFPHLYPIENAIITCHIIVVVSSYTQRRYILRKCKSIQQIKSFAIIIDWGMSVINVKEMRSVSI